jgi:hypothetical protein
VYELVIVLELAVVAILKSSVNLITNLNPVYSHKPLDIMQPSVVSTIRLAVAFLGNHHLSINFHREPIVLILVLGREVGWCGQCE